MHAHARARAALLGGLLALAAVATPARAALTPERAPNFILIRDDGTVAGTRWNDSASVDATVRKLASAYLSFAPDDAELLVFFTTFDADDSWWLLAMENHLEGLGWKNEPEGQDFDFMPLSKLEGVVNLGDLAYWGSVPEQEFTLTALQEIGHRWCCYLRFDAGTGTRADLLGRAQNHWSYFLDSGGSPMEGNSWRDNGDGSFTTTTDAAGTGYDDLALYTMGLLPPGEVPPLRLLEGPQVAGLRDLDGLPLSASSPPQRGTPLTVRATPRMVNLADVVRAEGERRPAFPTRNIFRMGVIVIARPGDDLATFGPVAEQLVDRIPAAFRAATRHKGTLLNITDSRVVDGGMADGGGEGGGGEDCGCQTGRRQSPFTAAALLGIATLTALLAIRSRRPLRR